MLSFARLFMYQLWLPPAGSMHFLGLAKPKAWCSPLTILNVCVLFCLWCSHAFHFAAFSVPLNVSIKSIFWVHWHFGAECSPWGPCSQSCIMNALSQQHPMIFGKHTSLTPLESSSLNCGEIPGEPLISCMSLKDKRSGKTNGKSSLSSWLDLYS